MLEPTRPALARPSNPVFVRSLTLFLLGLALASCGEPKGSRAPAPARPNVLLFVLDAARVDHFGAYGYERDTTPHIDAFAAGATRFTHAIADGSFTFASVSALFTGLPPDRTGLLRARRLGPGLTLLPERARAAGYRSRGYSENPFVTSAFGFDRGFGDFQTTLEHAAWKRDNRHFEHSDSRPGIDAMLDFMSEPSDRPFFGYLHLLRPHNPYAPPDDFAGRFGSRNRDEDGSTAALFELDRRGGPLRPERVDNLRALYDENLAVGDAMFGRLVEGMASRGLLDETIVVLLSDHGEAFYEHERLLHGSTPFEEVIRIPLLIRIPGHGGGVVDQPLQLAQLGERLADVVSGSQPPLDLIRVPAGARGATVSWAMQHERRACLRDRGRKLIVDTRTLEVVAYYDLEADPGEQKSLPLDRRGEQLLAEITARIRGGHASLSRPPAAAIDRDVLEQIRALGYAEE